MKIKIIKPHYTSKDIRQIYYGKDSTKRANYDNPAYRKLKRMEIASWFLFFIAICFITQTNLFNDYAEFLKLKLGQLFYSIKNIASITSNGSDHQAVNLIWKSYFAILLYFSLFFIPLLALGRQIYEFNCGRKKELIMNGELYKSPISREVYSEFFSLYTEAENIISHLESNESIESVNLDYITYTVEIWFRKNFITEKEKYSSIYSYAEKIFNSGVPDTVDFSIIDKKFNNVYKEKGELAMKKIRKIITGNNTRNYVGQIVKEYEGKVILLYTEKVYPEIKSVSYESLEQLEDVKKVSIEAIWHKEGIPCPNDIRERLETFLMPYEKQEEVILIFDNINDSMPWYVPYILENSELLAADILITVQDIDALERCFEINYTPASPEKNRFANLISKWITL